MKTYAGIKAEIARLEREAEKAMKKEAAGVIARIKEAIAAYGLTAHDLGFGKRSATKTKPAKSPNGATAVGVPKYRDPATGNTWTGRGKPPNWIKNVKDRDPFLIDETGAGRATASNGSATGKPGRQSAAAGKLRKGRELTKKSVRSARRGAVAPAVAVEAGAASQ